MSLPKRAARDSNEGPIVAALIVAGASVSQLAGGGLPDLLIGFEKRSMLREVKHRSTSGEVVRNTSNGHRPDERGLTKPQQDWWASWKGEPPQVVCTPEEALLSIGVPADRIPAIMAHPRVVAALKAAGS
jgi:hypothetical protein